MGNRAVIAFKNDPHATGIYVHWNGGPGSVAAFCAAADKMGARNPGGDDSYAMAGLARAVTLFMHYRPGELLSMGIGPLETLDTDNYDNGLYIIGEDWQIKERHFTTDKAMRPEHFEEYDSECYTGIQADIVERHLAICEIAGKEEAA